MRGAFLADKMPLNKAFAVHVSDLGAHRISLIVAEQLGLNRFDQGYFHCNSGTPFWVVAMPMRFVLTRLKGRLPVMLQRHFVAFQREFHFLCNLSISRRSNSCAISEACPPG
jgi:hypothetical protein